MKTHVRCGTLFSAGDQEGRPGQTLVHDEHGILEFVGPTEQAPKVDPRRVRCWIIPGSSSCRA